MMSTDQIFLLLDMWPLPRESVMLNISSATYYLFIIACLYVRPKSLAGRMLLGPGINASMQTATSPEMKHFRLSYYNSRASICNVGAKNFKSARCTSFTKLQRILLQHSGDMKLENNLLLPKIKQDIFIPHLFVGGN